MNDNEWFIYFIKSLKAKGLQALIHFQCNDNFFSLLLQPNEPKIIVVNYSPENQFNQQK